MDAGYKATTINKNKNMKTDIECNARLRKPVIISISGKIIPAQNEYISKRPVEADRFNEGVRRYITNEISIVDKIFLALTINQPNMSCYCIE